jgi:hypothetical protein
MTDVTKTVQGTETLSLEEIEKKIRLNQNWCQFFKDFDDEKYAFHVQELAKFKSMIKN